MTILNLLTAWIIPLLATALALLVVMHQPRFLWRAVSARETEAPPLLLVGLSLLLAAFSALAYSNWQQISAQKPSLPLPGATTQAFINSVIAPFRMGFAGSPQDQQAMQFAITFGALAVMCAYLLHRLRYSLFAVEIDQVHEAPPRRAVIMGLSPPGSDDAMKDAVAVLSALPIDKACKADVHRFPWQQNLRVLAHHFALPANPIARRWWQIWRRRPGPTARHVVILASPQTQAHAETFKTLAQACLANSGLTGIEIEVWREPIEYNDLIASRARLRAIIRYLRQHPVVAAQLDDISIDTTAGNKVFSIAGASATFASPIEFTYVEMDAPNAVLSFDVRAEFRPRGVRLK